MRNKSPLGVLIPNNLWDSLVEDLEALSSQNYLKTIAQARRSKKFYSAKGIEKELGL